MSLFNVRVDIEGESYQGWVAFNITQSLNNVVHEFTMTTTDTENEGISKFNKFGGSIADVYYNDELVVTGYIQGVSGGYSAGTNNAQRTKTIRCNSDAIDLVQCGHKGPYFWRVVPARTIIEDVTRPFGLRVQINAPLEDIPYEGFRVAVDESPYDIIKKIAERNGLLIYSQGDGSRITIDEDIPSNPLTELTTGDYFSINVNQNYDESFSEVLVKFQNNDKALVTAVSDKLIENDSSLRYRPITMIASSTEAQTEKLAQYIERRLTGDTVSAVVRLKTPFDKNGNLYRVGQRVWLNDEYEEVDQELMVDEIIHSLDTSNGFVCTLSLKIPETYGIKSTDIVTARRAIGRFGDVTKSF